MFQEYYKWCEKHPEATDEEKDEAWNRCIRMLEARQLVFELLLLYR